VRRPALAALLLAFGAGAGCGYQQGYSAGERLGVRSVAIAMVKNDTYRQGLDVQLARRLARDLTQFTGLVPGTPGGAEGRLEVTLREAQGRSISETTGGAVSEGAILLLVTTRLVDQRTGAVLYSAENQEWAEFRSPVGENLASATAEAVADLSRKILLGVDGSLAAPAAR
jgi:hypothetical protein